MLPKAILFDLDDTIVSFDGAGDLAWKEICSSFVERLNTPFDSNVLLETIKELKRWYWGDPDRHKTGRMNLTEARRDVVKMALSNLQFFNEEVACSLADSYTRRQEELICLFPDSISTLKKIKKMGIRMALITNGSSEKQRAKINRFRLLDYFEECLVEEEVGFGKPDIRIFEMALEKLKLAANGVWMVGDNLVWDVEAPQKLGIYSIWNDYRKKGLPNDSTIIPDRIIHSIAELPY